MDQLVLVDQYADTGPAALDNFELRFGNWTADPGWDYVIHSWGACETGAVAVTPPGPAGVLGIWGRSRGQSRMVEGGVLIGSRGEIVSAADPVGGAQGLGYLLRPSWGVSAIFRATTYPSLWQVTVTLNMYRQRG